MAAHSEELSLDVVKVFVIIIGNFVVHNINDVLHFITATISVLYLLWRWRRDWRKEKAEQHGKN
jgi:hypothetical protein